MRMYFVQRILVTSCARYDEARAEFQLRQDKEQLERQLTWALVVRIRACPATRPHGDAAHECTVPRVRAHRPEPTLLIDAR